MQWILLFFCHMFEKCIPCCCLFCLCLPENLQMKIFRPVAVLTDSSIFIKYGYTELKLLQNCSTYRFWQPLLAFWRYNIVNWHKNEQTFLPRRCWYSQFSAIWKTKHWRSLRHVLLFLFCSALIPEQTPFFHPFFFPFWKAQRNIFSEMSNGLSLQLLSYFPQTWSWSWASCCRSSRMWWRSWSPRLRAAAVHTSTSYRRPKAAQGWGTTAAWRTRTAVSVRTVVRMVCVCVCGCSGAQGSLHCGWVRLCGIPVFLEPLYQPRQLQLDTVNFLLTTGHVPVQFTHDNTACVHRNELQLRITRLL